MSKFDRNARFRASGFLIHALLTFVLVFIAGCGKRISDVGETPSDEASQTIAAEIRVVHYGILREIMHEGKTNAVVTLDRSLVGPDTFGVGAIAKLNGEVTIVGGTIWLSYPEGETGVITEAVADSTEQACLLVVSDIEAWTSTTIDADVPFDKIDNFVKTAAETAGINTDEPFAFKVSGKLVQLDAHVIDGTRLAPGSSSHEEHMKSAIKRHFESVKATLVGFYSRNHKGVFTHHDSDTHIHVVIEDDPFSGHVDGVTLLKGARLFLPKQ